MPVYNRLPCILRIPDYAGAYAFGRTTTRTTVVDGVPHKGVEVEAVELGLTRATGGDVTEVRLVAEAGDAEAGAGAEGDAALDGGPHEAG